MPVMYVCNLCIKKYMLLDYFIYLNKEKGFYVLKIDDVPLCLHALCFLSSTHNNFSSAIQHGKHVICRHFSTYMCGLKCSNLGLTCMKIINQ